MAFCCLVCTIHSSVLDAVGTALALQELWLPVMVPAHSSSIDLSVWHKEITGRDVVAHAYFDFNNIATIPGKPAGGEKRYVFSCGLCRFR